MLTKALLQSSVHTILQKSFEYANFLLHINYIYNNDIT